MQGRVLLVDRHGPVLRVLRRSRRRDHELPGSSAELMSACSYPGAMAGVSGISHIWTRRTSLTFRSACRIPVPALIRCTRPGRRSPGRPVESSCTSEPSTTQVTISMPRCGWVSKPFPAVMTSSLFAMSRPKWVLSGS